MCLLQSSFLLLHLTRSSLAYPPTPTPRSETEGLIPPMQGQRIVWPEMVMASRSHKGAAVIHLGDSNPPLLLFYEGGEVEAEVGHGDIWYDRLAHYSPHPFLLLSGHILVHISQCPLQREVALWLNSSQQNLNWHNTECFRIWDIKFLLLWNFLMISDVEPPFHVPVDHSYIFFEEMAIKLFYPFLNWAIDVLPLSYRSSHIIFYINCLSHIRFANTFSFSFCWPFPVWCKFLVRYSPICLFLLLLPVLLMSNPKIIDKNSIRKLIHDIFF